MQISPFAVEISGKGTRVARSPWNQLFDPVLPGLFLAWARRTDLSIPPELEAAAAAHGIQVADWKSLFDNLKASTEELQSLCDKQELKIQQLLDQIKELETQFATAREQAPSWRSPSALGNVTAC